MSRIHDALRSGAPSPALPERRQDAGAVASERPQAPVAPPFAPAEPPPETAPPPKRDAGRRAAQADAVLSTFGYTAISAARRRGGLLITLLILAALAVPALVGWTLIREA
jgi:hypothetical protein